MPRPQNRWSLPWGEAVTWPSSAVPPPGRGNEPPRQVTKKISLQPKVAHLLRSEPRGAGPAGSHRGVAGSSNAALIRASLSLHTR
jgi:hypothetical protein